MEGSSPLGWARSLDAVLADRSALDAFQEWLNEFSTPQYLSLHFAIRAYERKWLEGNPEKSQLAHQIYSTFLSSKTGSCKAIPGKYRAPIGERIRRGEELDEHVFTSCSSFVIEFLRKQHEEFVRSDNFIEAFNKMTSTSSCDPNAALHQNTVERRKSATNRRTQLTAEALLKSKHDRHTKLGETKLEKMYPPTRQPYVCNATTSHNDSAVSSSFSGEGSSRAYNTRLRQVRDDQARENTGTFTVPRVERPEQQRSSGGDQQFDHSSEPGRRHFAAVMTRKLLKHLDKIKMNDEMEKQINDIQEERYTTIDMVNCTDDNMSRIDEDEELDDYLKMKMTDDSQKGSAARSPKNKNGGGAAKSAPSSSKNTTLSPPPPPTARETPREVHLHHTTIRARRSAGNTFKEFALDAPLSSSSSSKPRHHQIDTRGSMSQSMIGGGASYSTSSSTFSRQSADSFAPSPLKSTWHTMTSSSASAGRAGSSKSSQMYDSSGIGSMAPSAFSATSSSIDSLRERRHHHHHHHNHHRGSKTNNLMSQSATTPRKHHKIGKNLSSLITISYLGTDKVPVVAHVPNDGPMTLAEFKRHFALPAGAQQLFFKTECEDGSAPFQLLLIKDERHLLPIFEGRIAAELR